MKIIFLYLSSIIVCGCANSTELEITPTIYRFNYEEFSTTRRSIDTETGLLPGIKFKLSQSHNDYTYNVYASANMGTVDYNGGTQSGQPHTTRTNEQIFQFGFEFISQEITSLPINLIFGFRLSQWDRDILNNNGILGLHEVYNWNEISLGIQYETQKQNNAFYWTSITGLYTYKPDIKIYLENTSVTLDLERKPGIRFNLGKTWTHNKHVNYGLSFMTEFWQFGRSNTAFTNDFFGSSVFITEPSSETFISGLEFSYIYIF